MKVRHQFDLASHALVAQAVEVYNHGPKITHDAPAKDADINNIVRRYGIDNIPMPPAVMDPSYYGETDFPDLSTALHRSREAEERFRALPADIRRRFSNDPGNLWTFVTDPNNLEEAVALGLLAKVMDNVPSTTAQAPPSPAGDTTS